MTIRVRGKTRRARLIIGVVSMLLIGVAFVVYAKSARETRGAFALAEDCPRGAMVYAQFSDLPALLKRWDESALKDQWLKSVNFRQFERHHLALKLLSRWQEFNDALGFTLDASTLAQSADNQMAIAIYDIGRLDLVLVAPLGEERAAAAKFWQSRDEFTGTELPDGTSYYSREVEADRGRQKQVIAFTTVHGRFVLATSEQLLLRTIANINGTSKKDRLADDPSFQTLTRALKPHFATVWIDQTKLNADWYFKRYWLMSNVNDLKWMRAGIFDLELQDDKWIEHRNFLRGAKSASKSSEIPAADAQRLADFIPENVPYFKLRALKGDARAPSEIVRDALFDRQPESHGAQAHWRWQSYDAADFYDTGEEDDWGARRYSPLNYKYDSTIDEPFDARVQGGEELGDGELRKTTEESASLNLQEALRAGRPIYSATVESPQMNAGPLFAEFRRAGVLTLQTPERLDSAALERAIVNVVESRLMIAGARAQLRWTNAGEGGMAWRELELPMLGWKLCYALKGHELFVANNAEILAAILKHGSATTPRVEVNDAVSLSDLTVIRLEQREQAFDQVVNTLDASGVKAYWKARHGEAKKKKNEDEGQTDGASQEFMSGNVASLLGVAWRVREIEIRRSVLPGLLREDVEMRLQ